MREPISKPIVPEPVGRSLRLRLLFWIVIWLMPAAVVSLYLGYSSVQEDVAQAHDDLVQTARATAADEEGVLSSGAQVLRALANQPEVRRGGKECDTALANAMKGLRYYTEIVRIAAGGEVLCAAPAPPARNAAEQPWWRDARERADFFVTPQVYSTAARANVLGGVLPLRTAVGEFEGVLEFALDVSWLDVLLRANPIPEGAVVAMFDREGALLAANDARLAREIFSGRPEMPTGRNLLSGTAGGRTWSYAFVPLLNQAIAVGFAMPNRTLFASTYFQVATNLLLPVLVLGLASAAIWIAADRLITRWIVYLQRIAMAYARGHYAIRPVALEEAPSEFRTLGETFSAMAAAVQDRDRRLREALAHKSLLIKETHHRVKNNLQIVMSLLSLQTAKLRDSAAQGALRQAQMRVNALALVHRILHEIEDLGAVDLRRLLQELAQQIHEGFGADRRDVQLNVDIAPRFVSSDLAVPLTLFTVEALTNAFKYAYPMGTRGGVIKLSLLPIGDGKLRLAVEDEGLGLDGQPHSAGIGSRLIQAFAQQVGGTATVARREHKGTVVELIFPDPVFQPREEEAMPA